MDLSVFTLNPVTLALLILGIVEFLKRFGMTGNKLMLVSMGVGILFATVYKFHELYPPAEPYVEVVFFLAWQPAYVPAVSTASSIIASLIERKQHRKIRRESRPENQMIKTFNNRRGVDVGAEQVYRSAQSLRPKGVYYDHHIYKTTRRC